MTERISLQFERMIRFIERQTGITLPETSHRQVRAYLEERMRELGMDTEAVIELMEKDEAEREFFIDAVTINETYFFREERHFTVLNNHVFPDLDVSARRPLIFWSAACATGEEALSISALAARFWSPADFRTYASDINKQALNRLRRREYGKNAFREDGSRFRELLTPYVNMSGDHCRVMDDLTDTVVIQPLNLMASNYEGIPARLHLVFLRNMLIYVKTERRHWIMDHIVERLADGGYLFLSSSEVPLLAHPDLILEQHEGCYYFRKKTLAEKQGGVKPKWEQAEHKGLPTGPHPAKAKPKPPPRKPEVSEILRHVSRRLHNPLYEVGDDPTFEAALAYLKAVYLLNADDVDRARSAVDDLVKEWGPNEITDYLKGVAAIRADDAESARNGFESSLKRNPGFWPALFQQALLVQKNEPKQAVRDFAACRRFIENYISRNAFTYQFLLEGFNARYFSEICQGWIARLQAKGVTHGA